MRANLLFDKDFALLAPNKKEREAPVFESESPPPFASVRSQKDGFIARHEQAAETRNCVILFLVEENEPNRSKTMSTAIAPAAPPKLLTYEAYMAEETDYRRYDILDGEKILMPGATDNHQDIAFNIGTIFREFGVRTQKGKMKMAPRDVQISRVPLRTRQPDVFFISNERRALNPAPNDPAPMTAAPELVVEIISNSETARRFNDKVRDYCKVEVKECWKILPDTQTVEVLRLSRSGAESVRVYGMSETVQSLTFPDLTVAVEAIFAV